MNTVIFALDERLGNPGDTLSVTGHVDQDDYSLGDHVFSLPSGIDYDVALTNAGEGILVTGILKTHVVGVCDRCLEEAAFDIAGEVDGYYLFEEPEHPDGDDSGDDLDYFLVFDDHMIDLAEALSSTLIMETPFVVLCRPGCKGLCPVCGANLNGGDCGHAKQVERDRLATNPFAVLGDLDLGDVDDEGDDDSKDGDE